MYQSARRVGKRYIISKLNGGTNTQQEYTRLPSNPITNETKKLNLQEYTTNLSTTSLSSSFSESLNSLNHKSLSLYEIVSNRFIGYHFVLKRPTSRCMHTLSNGTLLNPNEIEDTLNKFGIPFHKGFTGFLVESQSCCGNTSCKTFINNRTGDTICRGCGIHRSWQDFLKSQSNDETRFLTGSEPEKVVVSVTGDSESLWSSSCSLDSENISMVVTNHLSLETYKLFKVHVSADGSSLLYPYYDISKKRIVKCVSDHQHQGKYVEIMNIDSASLFGWNTINDGDSTLVLTSSEVDAMVVKQVTGLPSLSVSDISLPPSVLPFLEQFSKIILWFPDTYRDQENLQGFARKLDLKRCWKVTSSHSPRRLLNESNVDSIKTSISKSRHMSHDRIVTFKDMRTELYHELVNAKMNAGVPFTRFPALNEYLKGHRRGELTVFTGPTGSGKTTFLSELSLDLCLQGVKTLWGSFEIKNIRLLNTLMHQFAGFAVEKHMDKFLRWSEKFESLPLYFMSYYGSQDLQDVLKTIEYSVYAHDIEHVIIDNLQFMTSTASNASGDDRFLVMDRAIAAFRRCASDLNIHVTVVVHPRKENDGGALQTASIYGSAKASQEADNVLILQRSDQLSMQITKNRFSGTVGALPLSFHPDSLCLSGFHRNVESEEEILPALKIRRPVSNVKVYRKNDR